MLLAHESQRLARSIGGHVISSALLLVVLLGGFCTWAGVAAINAAVIAIGTVVVEGNKKSIQHRDGGIVTDILFREGDRVEAGDLLVRLDGTQLSSELKAAEKRLFELRLRKLRLNMERQAKPSAAATAMFQDMASITTDPELDSLISTQQDLYRSRRLSQARRRLQLQQRIVRFRIEIAGAQRVSEAKQGELQLLEKELSQLKVLERSDLVSMARIGPIRRERARAIGEVERIKSTIASRQEQITEIEAKLEEMEAQLLSETLTELQNAEGEILQVEERQVALKDKLSRLEIRAPEPGRVHELLVHTTGGVIKAGDTILSIVPDTQQLVLDAKIGVNDRDDVRASMPARIRFLAFNQRDTPEASGRVVWVSPDQFNDKASGAPYYKARIALDPGNENAQLLRRITAGMTAEILITGKERTVASYLLRPIFDQFNRAFRES